MPKVKDRAALMKRDLEEQYGLALKSLAEAHDLRKSSLGQSWEAAHRDQPIFTPAAEKATFRWILMLDDCGMPPRVDRPTGAVMELAKSENSR